MADIDTADSIQPPDGVAGAALTGPALTGPALTGPALTGPALTGPALKIFINYRHDDVPFAAAALYHQLEQRFGDSGSEFVTTSGSGTVAIWNAHGRKPRNSISACPSPGTASFSPDSSKIVVACGDGTVRVFDADSGRTLTVIHPVTGGSVNQAAFSPDGQSIALAVETGNTGSVEIWNAELASPSVSKLQTIADQRVQQLTPAQVQQYLNGAGG